MKAVFFGTPNYSTPSIRALLDADIDVPLVCTRPVRRAGRGRLKTPTPVAIFAEELGIQVITPDPLDADATSEIIQRGSRRVRGGRIRQVHPARALGATSTRRCEPPPIAASKASRT